MSLRPILLGLVLLAAACTGEGAAPPASGTAEVRLDVGGIRVDARVVTTRAARRRGLQGVTALAAKAGMLFVYPTAEHRQFWMQDCKIALDIAFLAADGTVLQVDTLPPPSAARPGPAESRRSPPAQFVLETGADFFARHGLGVGTRVRIPATIDPAHAEE